MKLLFHQKDICNAGGMEKVLSTKLRWLSENTDAEIILVTTDQKSRPSFFPLPDNVRHIDLGINYSDGIDRPFLQKGWRFLRLKHLHRRRLTDLLLRERPDVTISLYPTVSGFIPSIPDGSKKILEFHFSRYFRDYYNRKGLTRLVDRMRTFFDPLMVRKFDRFVVLTLADRKLWGHLPNIAVIPNPITPMGAAELNPSISSPNSSQSDPDRIHCFHRVIAVGRLAHIKGFDLLLQAWQLVKQRPDSSSWHLDIFGNGEEQNKLYSLCHSLGLDDSVRILPPVHDITREIAASDILAIPSRSEGFSLVLGEAMSVGTPVVAFACQSGPPELIKNKKTGLLVPPDDVGSMAERLYSLMTDHDLRHKLGQESLRRSKLYSPEIVMQMWLDIFNA